MEGIDRSSTSSIIFSILPDVIYPLSLLPPQLTGGFLWVLKSLKKQQSLLQHKIQMFVLVMLFGLSSNLGTPSGSWGPGAPVAKPVHQNVQVVNRQQVAPVVSRTAAGRGAAKNVVASKRSTEAKHKTAASQGLSARAIRPGKEHFHSRPLAMVKTAAPAAPQAAPKRVSQEALRRDLIKLVDASVLKFKHAFEGPTRDTLIVLLTTAMVVPIMTRLKTSPILGFLLTGMLLGPHGLYLIKDIKTTEALAELGIVFFLFEMGLELSIARLLSMKRDVFGLGSLQFTTTAAVIFGVARLMGLTAPASVVVGGALALSSSAFVLQLLRDSDSLGTRYGKASFGILLFQDLAVIPLLVVTPLLAGGGGSMAWAVGAAGMKAILAFAVIILFGKLILDKIFNFVAKAESHEAFLAVILVTVLAMSTLTEGLGLSNTLGAFMAGVLLAETKYRYQVRSILQLDAHGVAR